MIGMAASGSRGTTIVSSPVGAVRIIGIRQDDPVGLTLGRAKRASGRANASPCATAMIVEALKRRPSLIISVGHGLPGVGCGVPPNESRLSCGRRADRRKDMEPLGRLGGEATQLFPTGERPPASSAC